MTYTICASIQDEASVMIASKNIVSVSKISAEDTARRFFRKNSIPMIDIVKTVASENFVQWSATVNTLETSAVEEIVVEEPKVETAPTAIKGIYDNLQLTMENLYDRWSDESEYEDWDEYVAVVKAEVEKIPMASFVKLTKRPFAVKFNQWSTAHELKVTASAVYFK